MRCMWRRHVPESSSWEERELSSWISFDWHLDSEGAAGPSYPLEGGSPRAEVSTTHHSDHTVQSREFARMLPRAIQNVMRTLPVVSCLQARYKPCVQQPLPSPVGGARCGCAARWAVRECGVRGAGCGVWRAGCEAGAWGVIRVKLTTARHHPDVLQRQRLAQRLIHHVASHGRKQ